MQDPFVSSMAKALEMLSESDFDLLVTAPRRPLREELPYCTHPPHRLYTWMAADKTFCVACCKCGVVLKGGV